MKRIWLPLLTMALAGCAATGKAPPAAPGGAPPEAASPTDASAAPPSATTTAPGTDAAPKVVQGLGAAVTSPLSDFNLIRARIPPILLAAREAPYRLPPERGCAALAAEIDAHDQALGPDLDAPDSADRPSLLERGADMAGSAALNAVQGAVSGAIPFRGWVRKLTGAERRDRRVAAAVNAGSLRRAFLKGLARAQGCAPAPAAPLGPAPESAAAPATDPAEPAVVSLQEFTPE
ncbi:hypothetical protein [Azohydromonas caseinilytica]|uniref:hypothetical protein n=1 Tax=Azohydromonas caseinilytica TaxID=2728836 RepID=UPI00197C16DA|nr:hypothetical protein [Azohydromonas caseinilytica]